MKFRNRLTRVFLFCLAYTLGATWGDSMAQAYPARFGLSPDNSQGLLLSVINSAKKELIINIYQFDSPPVAKALISQIKKGVKVEILIEGQPVGKITSKGQETLQLLRTAMDRNSPSSRLFLMTSMPSENTTVQRRFAFDHAKYVIADGVNVLVSSENFTGSGHPNGGYVGNRGWETVIESSALASKMRAIFDQDTDFSPGDVIEWTGASALPAPTTPESAVAAPGKRTLKAIPIGKGDVTHMEILSSPNSLEGLVSLMRSAKDHLDVEQMSLPSQWKDPTPVLSPLVAEMIAAARRGVSVRVLLNDEDAFGRLLLLGAQSPSPEPLPVATKKPNEITARLLLQAARCEKLPLAARIVNTQNTQISYIHNKGYLIDRNKALVSSINGTRNSVVNNREIALLLESKDAAQYFGKAFGFDWDSSAELSPEPNPTPCEPLNLPMNLTSRFFSLPN
ncbi:phospholipase D-like domain-containing protein [Bdellovibrionota bacterium FG-2]